MSESRVIITLMSGKTIQQIDSFLRDLNLMGKHIEIKCVEPAVAALATSIIGNMNKVLIVNGTVVKSFDTNYVVGDTVGWIAGYKLYKF